MPVACRLSRRPRGRFCRREAPDRIAKLLGLVAGLCFDGCFGSWPSVYAARSTCSRLIFQAIVTGDYSPRALSSPRMPIWLQPITRSMIPNTGSTVCLRSPCSARPCPQPVGHFDHRIVGFGRRFVWREALQHRNMVRFALHRQHWLDSLRRAGVGVGGTEVARVAQ